MRMFTKMGVTAASAALPVLLWAGAASAQQSGSQSQSQSGSQSQSQSGSQSQSQSGSQQTSFTTIGTLPTTTNTGGALARTGNEGMLPLAVGGAALAGAVAVRRGLRRRSAA